MALVTSLESVAGCSPSLNVFSDPELPASVPVAIFQSGEGGPEQAVGHL
jgi:hypothetical protein